MCSMDITDHFYVHFSWLTTASCFTGASCCARRSSSTRVGGGFSLQRACARRSCVVPFKNCSCGHHGFIPLCTDIRSDLRNALNAHKAISSCYYALDYY